MNLAHYHVTELSIKTIKLSTLFFAYFLCTAYSIGEYHQPEKSITNVMPSSISEAKKEMVAMKEKFLDVDCNVKNEFSTEKQVNNGDNINIILGLVFMSNLTECKDNEKSKYFLLKAANNNNTTAQYHLCSLLKHLERGDEAIKWCYVAQKNGSIKAKNKMTFFKSIYVSDEYKIMFDNAVKEGELLFKKLRK